MPLRNVKEQICFYQKRQKLRFATVSDVALYSHIV